jgi:hypothetical protein
MRRCEPGDLDNIQGIVFLHLVHIPTIFGFVILELSTRGTLEVSSIERRAFGNLGIGSIGTRVIRLVWNERDGFRLGLAYYYIPCTLSIGFHHPFFVSCLSPFGTWIPDAPFCFPRERRAERFCQRELVFDMRS